MSSQERPPFIPEGVVARRKRMELGEPKRRRVSDGSAHGPALESVCGAGLWSINPLGPGHPPGWRCRVRQWQKQFSHQKWVLSLRC